MKRQRITEGAILEIKIENEYYVYAQILKNKLGYAFFDFRSNQRLVELDVLLKCKILFILMVYNDIITEGIWRKVGVLPIRQDLLVQPFKFIQDYDKPDNFELYNPNNGDIIKANKAECIGLERASVWEAKHVEDRIRDYYLGAKNIWVEQLKIK